MRKIGSQLWQVSLCCLWRSFISAACETWDVATQLWGKICRNLERTPPSVPCKVRSWRQVGLGGLFKDPRTMGSIGEFEFWLLVHSIRRATVCRNLIYHDARNSSSASSDRKWESHLCALPVNLAILSLQQQRDSFARLLSSQPYDLFLLSWTKMLRILRTRTTSFLDTSTTNTEWLGRAVVVTVTVLQKSEVISLTAAGL